jgi:hypothetical protein
VRSSTVIAGHETQLERLGGWGGAMFEREPESFSFGARADEVGGMVGPGMEIAGASKGLSEMGPDGFAHVVDEDDGHVVPSLQLAQVPEQSRDICRTILVEPMESYQRVEQEEPGAEALEGGGKKFLIGGLVEPDDGSGDDVDIERIEVDAAVQADPREASAHVGQIIFSEVDESGAGVPHSEVTEARGSRGEADGHVEAEPTLCALGRSAQDSDATGPYLIDAPRDTLAAPGLEGGGPTSGQGLIAHDAG